MATSDGLKYGKWYLDEESGGLGVGSILVLA